MSSIQVNIHPARNGHRTARLEQVECTALNIVSDDNNGATYATIYLRDDVAAKLVAAILNNDVATASDAFETWLSDHYEPEPPTYDDALASKLASEHRHDDALRDAGRGHLVKP